MKRRRYPRIDIALVAFERTERNPVETTRLAIAGLVRAMPIRLSR